MHQKKIFSLTAFGILFASQVTSLQAAEFPYEGSYQIQAGYNQFEQLRGPQSFITSQDYTTSPTNRISDGIKTQYSASRAYVDGYSVGVSAGVSTEERESAPPSRTYADITNEPELPQKPFSPNEAAARAGFIQEFTVIGAGEATFTFAWDGTLQSSDQNGLAGYNFNASITNRSIYENLPFVANVTKEEIQQPPQMINEYIDDYKEVINGSSSVNESRNITLDFNESDIGSTFTVRLSLSAFADYDPDGFFNQPTSFAGAFAANSISEVEVPANYAFADFYNTGTLTFSGQGIVSANVAPVPVPAAVWLFGSAIMGLVGFRRRQAQA